MSSSELSLQIAELLAAVDAALAAGNVYPFLPDIRASLVQIKGKHGVSWEERSHLAAGLERLILEDFAFSESVLGGTLLEFAEQYVLHGFA